MKSEWFTKLSGCPTCFYCLLVYFEKRKKDMLKGICLQSDLSIALKRPAQLFCTVQVKVGTGAYRQLYLTQFSASFEPTQKCIKPVRRWDIIQKINSYSTCAPAINHPYIHLGSAAAVQVLILGLVQQVLLNAPLTWLYTMFCESLPHALHACVFTRKWHSCIHTAVTN